MLKILIALMLASCGTDEGALSPETKEQVSAKPSVSPTPSPLVGPATPSVTAKPESQAILAQATPSPSPTATPVPYQSLRLIDQQAYETSEWKFDFRNQTTEYSDATKFWYTTGGIVVTRKLASGNYLCPFHTTIDFGATYGTITFTTDYAQPGCGGVGNDYRFNFRIKNNQLETF